MRLSLDASEPSLRQAPTGVDDFGEQSRCPPPNCRQDERGDSATLLARSLDVNTNGIGGAGGAGSVGSFFLLLFTVSSGSQSLHSPVSPFVTQIRFEIVARSVQIWAQYFNIGFSQDSSDDK